MTDGNKKGKTKIKLFLGFSLGSLYAMSVVLFFVCMLAFLNGGYIVISVDDFNESLFEMVLMFIGLLCGGISIFFIIRWYR
jgi:hypothetical protein